MTKLPPNLFVSAKSSRAIPAARPLRRDLLIQATLDAGVRAIDYYPTVVIDDRVIRTDAIVLDRDDGRYVIDFVDARPETDPSGEGLLQLAFDQNCTGMMEIRSADVRREPRLSAARAVWQFADMTASTHDRAQVLDALDAEGPVPIRALDGLTSTGRSVVDVVYALACEGSVALDLTGGLDGRTIVRAGVAAVPGLRLRYGT